MIRDTTRRRATHFAPMLRPLAALLLIALMPALAACTTAEGTNAFADPNVFEHEVMDSTLQGLDILPQPPTKVDNKDRTPLVLPKTASLPAPSKNNMTADLPVDSSNPQINTAGLTQADLAHLRNARVIDLQALDGRPLTDEERKQMTARMAQANVAVNTTRPLYLPPTSYFTDYKGKDAICKAKDGTLVALSDPRCPDKIRNTFHPDLGPAQSVDAQMTSDQNNMENGLLPGDKGYQ
ncbi:MAG TPA: hypothetical protein VL418_00015 [Devosiaceae bacterium]|nr:hypothetical protein [Devosiaceae bacterium]